jgi:hypothetical protein
VVEVVLDGALADTEPVGDLAVGVAETQELGHLPLAARECRQSVLYRGGRGRETGGTLGVGRRRVGDSEHDDSGHPQEKEMHYRSR